MPWPGLMVIWLSKLDLNFFRKILSLVIPYHNRKPWTVQSCFASRTVQGLGEEKWPNWSRPTLSNCRHDPIRSVPTTTLAICSYPLERSPPWSPCCPKFLKSKHGRGNYSPVGDQVCTPPAACSPRFLKKYPGRGNVWEIVDGHVLCLIDHMSQS